MMLVSDILRLVNHFRASIPVDVEGLVWALGIVLRKPYLANNVSGMIRKTGDTFEISVNARHAPTRQRFTIAHEIGHFVLHRSLMGDGNVDDCAYRSDGSVTNNRIGARQETEANQFAANLLMPSSAIKQLRREGVTEPAAMALRLGVSEGAMKIRLGIQPKRLAEATI